MISRFREKGRENLEKWPEEIDDVGFWGRVEYFLDPDRDPYGDDIGLYDHIRYGSEGGRNVFERQSSYFQEHLEELGIEEGDTVLELGASTAKLSEFLEEEGYQAFSADLMRQGQEIARGEGRSRAQFQMDATELGFKDDSFDYVVAPRVMHLVDDPEMIEEMDRVAEEGFVFDYFRKWSAKGVQKHLMRSIDSEVHTDGYMRGLVAGITDKEPRMTSGFPLPYAFETPVTDKDDADIIDWFQSRFEDNPIIDSVGYISSESSER